MLTLSRHFLAAAIIAVGVALPYGIRAQDEIPRRPEVAAASKQAEQALARFKIPQGWQSSVFAAEPLMANPVAFFVDHKGRFYVCESYRQSRGVTDNRKHDSKWLDDDLAAMTVADRIAYHKKHLKEKVVEYTHYDDVIRIVEDRDRDGKADHSRIFADHFNRIEDGTGAGVLANGNDVYYTCIPKLYRLRDTTGDGVSDERTALHDGYGVRVAFRGHDLHGLIIGPDGKLYYSIGDRGYNIQTKTGRFTNPDSGAVFRCNLDGSDLEIVATGLRNPQELAFDEYGNLFTGDNNSDSGDKARWVYIVEGSDTGWRMWYQYLKDRGPFNREKIWHPQHEGQPAYIVPPIANLADGPSGLAYYPGTGLSDHYQGRFFLCDFRGTAGRSGVRTFRVKPKGAFFRVADQEQSIWKILATDIAFGADGHLYISDWVDGWNGDGRGRIYKFSAPEAARKQAAAVHALLRDNRWDDELSADLADYLYHDDQRVRQAAQFALARRKSLPTLIDMASRGRGQLARIHAIWGLGQVARSAPRLKKRMLRLFGELLADSDDEIRAQAMRQIGDLKLATLAKQVTEGLKDEAPRVRQFAAMAVGKLQLRDAIPDVLSMLEENAGADPILRHSGVMALAGAGSEVELVAAANHNSSHARMGVLLAMRRHGSASITRFLQDIDPLLVVEAARAIHDVPIDAALPALAKRAKQSEVGSLALLHRVLNANYRLGQSEHAAAIASVAANRETSEQMRIESLEMLEGWAQPSQRDRVLGAWRPLQPRTPQVAADAIRTVLPAVLSAPPAVQKVAVRVAARLGIREVVPSLRATLADGSKPASDRADALRALAVLKDAQLQKFADQLISAKQETLRIAALEVIAAKDAARGLKLIESAVQSPAMLERQGALRTLAAVKSDKKQQLLQQLIQQLTKGKIPLDTQLELHEVVQSSDFPKLRSQIDAYEQKVKDDYPSHLLRFRTALAGGNANRGLQVFQATTHSCVRCHKINQRGGDVGPDLSKIAKDKKAAYLLEAVVTPNKQIAKDFESATILDADGRVHVGVLRKEDDKQVQLVTAEGKRIVILKDDIDERRKSKSAMPEDLIKNLSLRDLRDLVAYLSTLK